MCDLLGMHEPGADGSDESLPLEGPVPEGHQYVASGAGFPDAEIPRLGRRVGRIGEHAHRSSEGGLDLLERDTVLLALLGVSRVPVEARDGFAHRDSLADVCTNVHTIRRAQWSVPDPSVALASQAIVTFWWRSFLEDATPPPAPPQRRGVVRARALRKRKCRECPGMRTPGLVS